MKNMIHKIIIVLSLIFIVLSCKDNHKKGIDDSENGISGHYFNSSQDHVLRSIELQKNTKGYDVVLHYRDSLLKFSTGDPGDEIVLHLDNEYELHLYMNDEELRVYRVVENDYQPEDIDWTFYKKD